MRLARSVAKNFKLLFRNRESAYTIFVGPLLIILLVSVALLGEQAPALDLGVVRVSQEERVGDVAARVTEALVARGHTVAAYSLDEPCLAAVRENTLHACIVVGPLQSSSVPIIAHLDLTRTTVAYRIADGLSDALDLSAEELRAQLAGDAIARMQLAQSYLENNTQGADATLGQLNAARQNMQQAQSALENASDTALNVSLVGLRGYHLGLHQNAQTITERSAGVLQEASTTLFRVANECEECEESFVEDILAMSENISQTRRDILQIADDKNPQLLEDAELLLRRVADDLSEVNDSIELNTQMHAIGRREARNALGALEASQAQLGSLVIQLQQARHVLADSSTAEELSRPVTVRVQGVTTENGNARATYPYLLTLVIMFMGLLLASTLIVSDRNSRAAFRNFTTPTADGFHVLAGFITAAIILIVQVAVIVAASGLIINAGHLYSLSAMIVLLLAVALFTFLGMIIGYLSARQETAMIASISVGSILLFVSNLVVPIESMAKIVQAASAYNPYVLVSELLRTSMFYGVGLEDLWRLLLPILLSCAVLLLLTILIQRHARKSYFRQDGGMLATHTPGPLVLGTRVVHNEVELLDALDRMTRAEFEAFVDAGHNPISAWLEKDVKNVSLGRKMRTTSKEKMMIRLDEYLRKHGKKIKGGT
jgi:ABC-type polysaccharide/polyol phosphate export permease